jgi:hypothetical protein
MNHDGWRLAEHGFKVVRSLRERLPNPVNEQWECQRKPLAERADHLKDRNHQWLIGPAGTATCAS